MFQFTIRHGDERFTRRRRGKRRPKWRWPDLATHERTLRSTGRRRHPNRRPDCASADTGAVNLPVNVFLCRTDPSTGVCLGALSSLVTTQINAGQTPTFGIFVQGGGTLVPLDPANNRVFVRFKDAAGVTRGSTSVAVRTQ